jgi:hypothetical protein
MFMDTVGDQIVPSSNFWVMQVSRPILFKFPLNFPDNFPNPSKTHGD